MSVQFTQESVSVPKETNEVMKLFVDFAKIVRQGGDYSTVIPDLVKAIDGVSEVPNEFKDAKWAEVRCVVLRAVDIVEALSAPKVVQAVQVLPKA